MPKNLKGARKTTNIRIDEGLTDRIDRYVMQQRMGSKPQVIEKATSAFLDAEKKAGRFKE